MAEQTIPTKFKLRHDIASNWTSKNPVLLEGEVGFETDTKNFKVGDGFSQWSSLSYYIPSVKQTAIVNFGLNIMHDAEKEFDMKYWSSYHILGEITEVGQILGNFYPVTITGSDGSGEYSDYRVIMQELVVTNIVVENSSVTKVYVKATSDTSSILYSRKMYQSTSTSESAKAQLMSRYGISKALEDTATKKDISAIINYGTNMRYGQNTQLDWYYKHQYLRFGEITTIGQRVLNLYSQSYNAGDYQTHTIYTQELVVVDISKGTGLQGSDIITFTPTKESYSGFYVNNMYHTLGTSNYDKQVVMSRYGVSKALEGINKTIIRRWS